jgi:spermidine dehydrogenase
MKKKSSEEPLEITRRDFVNGTLVGAGAALLGVAAPGCTARQAPLPTTGDPWTGYGGVGDYATANGNVASVREAAHLIRDGLTGALMNEVEETGEEYDMVIIGGGFSGLGAAYQFHKDRGGAGNCLILENHSVFGGEARQNEFEVDGYRLFGPQGSNDFGPPDKDDDSLIADIYRDTGLPFDYGFVPQSKNAVRAPLEHFYGMYWEEERYDTGYFLGKDADPSWVVNPRSDKLDRLPWSDEFKDEMNRAFADVEDFYTGDDLDAWLDSMSYKELLEDVMGFSPKVTEYFDPVLAISMGGVGADVYSAYSAKLLDMPGTGVHYTYDPDVESAYSFPGGNAGIFRHIVKYLNPDSIEGGNSFEEILFNAIDFTALDRPDNSLNIRLSATAIDVSHEGSAKTADHVNVTYHQDGEVRRVKARTVVMGIGGWVARRIASDMPAEISEAYAQFYHSPVLVVNVALRNWRFLERLGIAAGRWFEGFGGFFAIRRPMETGDLTQPFDPDKPTVMTFYVPFNNPGHPPEVQGAIGRAELLSKSYADYEKEVVEQMTDMFADHGFDANRDIAGFVLNRWGHAYISPQPGFHFGRDGKAAPKEIVRRGYGRVQFGHSELTGYMSHTRALSEGARAAQAAIGVLAKGRGADQSSS